MNQIITIRYEPHVLMNQIITWVSARIGKDHYKTEVFTDNHKITADEPVDLGGKDLAPDPGDYLRTALASCTAITLRMYADRKKMAVERIEVKVGTETRDGKTIFHRKILITGTIDNDQRERMLDIANACPIHKVLVNPIEMITDLV
jgi:putative redox protein